MFCTCSQGLSSVPRRIALFDRCPVVQASINTIMFATFTTNVRKPPVSPLEAVAEGLPTPVRTRVRSTYQSQAPSSLSSSSSSSSSKFSNSLRSSPSTPLPSLSKPKKPMRPSTPSYSPVYSPPPLHVTTPILTPAPLPSHLLSSSSSSLPLVSSTVSKNSALFQSLPTDAILDEQHSLSIAIIGEPNAGKSTLLNHLIKSHVSAVSPKYNTTRTRILGVHTEGNTQLLFHDTPGLVHEGGESGWKYHKELVTASLDAAGDADYILYVIDIARRFDNTVYRSLKTAIQLCTQNNSKLLIVANKCDLIKGLPLDSTQKQLSEKLCSPSGSTNGGATVSTGIPKIALLSSLIFPNSFINPSIARSVFPNNSSTTESNHINKEQDSPAKSDPLRGRRKHHQDVLALKLDILANTLENLCYEYDTYLLQQQQTRQQQQSKGTHAQPKGNNASQDHGNDDDESVTVSIPRVARNLLVPGCIVPLAAVHNNGIDLLRNLLISISPVRPWLYSKEIITDRPLIEQIADIIREKFFRRLHYEIPYSIHQETRSWRELDASSSSFFTASDHPNPTINYNRITEIHQDIIVPTQRVARMLLGNKGVPIKEIAEIAKIDIEKILKTRVRLHLHVTVKENRKKNFNG